MQLHIYMVQWAAVGKVQETCTEVYRYFGRIRGFGRSDGGVYLGAWAGPMLGWIVGGLAV